MEIRPIQVVGWSKEDFQHLNDKLAAYIDTQKILYLLTMRGQKDSKLSLEDPAATLAIDVSEQAIERPVKSQKAY